ncbi:putative oxidoreductase [Capnocytophaga haemolytica]|jgi:doxX family protein|uniref:DoxX n=1 Tax=Capnocytophaga haemolytica TaxID=45243 RepID=A0AAX2GZA8_9FLAO|nr:DoxX family protein [Capnocytophaga haemolytica]AMD84782.1 DoxX family protein [Capnocytophaga haemolytica]SFN74052.1 putative oxidoreductase [Capnocytophaga haemolytica]SNV07505.1 DoxX [Capnocytophaga haemolytica]
MRNVNSGLLILRLTVGLLMIPHGINKLVHPAALDYVKSTLVDKGLPFWIAYLVFLSEIIAPLFVVLGFRTRGAAFVMFLGGLMTLYLAYSNVLFATTEHGGWAPELPALFMFGALVLCFTGGGKMAVSHRHKWD